MSQLLLHSLLAMLDQEFCGGYPMSRLWLLIGLNAFAFTGLAIWLTRKRWHFLDILVGAFLLLVAQIFLTEMLLAALGYLREQEVIGLFLALSIGVWSRAGRNSLYMIRRIKQQVRELCTEIRWYEWLLPSLMAIVLIWSFLEARYVPALSWDANMYHIPIAALRLQEGSLKRLSSSWAWIEGYPQSSEMLIAWILLLSKSQILADSVQWPFLLFGTLSLISLAQKMGARFLPSIAGSIMWLAAPVAILQSQDARNDLIIAALYWMGLNFVLQHPLSFLSILLSGVAAGLMLGSKVGAFGLAGVVGGFALWRFRRVSNKRAVLLAFLIGWIGFGLLNAYWYVANWQQTGNPLWPLNVSLGPFHLRGGFSLEGYAAHYTPPQIANRPFWEQWWVVWMEPSSYYASGAKLSGFGPLWIILGLPSIFIWASLERKGWALILSAFLVMATQPLSWHTRYVLFLPGLGSIALACVLSKFRPWVRRCITPLLVIGVLFSLLVTINIHNVKYMWIPDTYRVSVFSGWPLLGGAYRWMETNSRSPDTIIYGGPIAFVAPLWGEDLRHAVRYIRPSDQEAWQQSVLESGSHWAFAVAGSKEDEFLATFPYFQLVVEDRRIEEPPTLKINVYQVIQDRRLGNRNTP